MPWWQTKNLQLDNSSQGTVTITPVVLTGPILDDARNDVYGL